MVAILLPSYKQYTVKQGEADAGDQLSEGEVEVDNQRSVRVLSPEGGGRWMGGRRKPLLMNSTIQLHYTEVTADKIQTRDAIMTGQAAYCVQFLYESLTPNCQATFHV
jgi:hypothetical protein